MCLSKVNISFVGKKVFFSKYDEKKETYPLGQHFILSLFYSSNKMAIEAETQINRNSIYLVGLSRFFLHLEYPAHISFLLSPFTWFEGEEWEVKKVLPYLSPTLAKAKNILSSKETLCIISGIGFQQIRAKEVYHFGQFFIKCLKMNVWLPYDSFALIPISRFGLKQSRNPSFIAIICNWNHVSFSPRTLKSRARLLRHKTEIR